MAGIDSEVKRLEAVIDTHGRALAEQQGKLDRVKKDLADAKAERAQRYGDKNPDAEEARLTRAVAEAERTEKIARDRHAQVQQQLTAAKTQMTSLKTRIEQRTPELERARV